MTSVSSIVYSALSLIVRYREITSVNVVTTLIRNTAAYFSGRFHQIQKGKLTSRTSKGVFVLLSSEKEFFSVLKSLKNIN